MPTEPPSGTALRARTLLNRDDPRIPAVAAQLGPELTDPTSPDRIHYLAALAVATLDARTELQQRANRQQEGARRVGAAVAVALSVLVLAAATAGVTALWQAVLN